MAPRQHISTSQWDAKTTKTARGRRRSKTHLLSGVPLLLLALSICWLVTLMTMMSSNVHPAKLDDNMKSRPVRTKRSRLEPQPKETQKYQTLTFLSKFYPRTIQVDYNGNRTGLAQQLKTSQEGFEKKNHSKHKRRIYLGSVARASQQYIEKSRHYEERDPLYEGDCVPMQSWQETLFPSCNSFHELDPYGSVLIGNFQHLDKGGYNDVFFFNNTSELLVMKELVYGTYYTDRNFDRVRRDALIMERLTASPHIVSVYGHCGFAMLVPYAAHGTLDDEIWYWRHREKELSSLDRLKYALNVAAALHAFHDIDGEGISSVTHGDLKASQFVFMNGILTMGDFNRGRFLRRNSTFPESACPYTIGANDGKYRSPEEYMYLPETSAIDIWAMGSIFYELLTGKHVWRELEDEEANKKTIAGELPPINPMLKSSTDPVDKLLIAAIHLCYVYDPNKRGTAKQVYEYLKSGWEKYNHLSLGNEK